MKYEAAAAALLLLAAGFEIARVVAGMPWGGFVPWVSALISCLLAALFLATVASFFLRRRRPGFESPAWILALASPMALFAHGVVTRAAKDELGIAYMVGAVLVAFLIKRSYDRGELTRAVAHAREARRAR
jgi:hypothetical protein